MLQSTTPCYSVEQYPESCSGPMFLCIKLSKLVQLLNVHPNARSAMFRLLQTISLNIAFLLYCGGESSGVDHGTNIILHKRFYVSFFFTFSLRFVYNISPYIIFLLCDVLFTTTDIGYGSSLVPFYPLCAERTPCRRNDSSRGYAVHLI